MTDNFAPQPTEPEPKPFPRAEVLLAVLFHRKSIAVVAVVASAATIIYLISQVKK